MKIPVETVKLSQLKPAPYNPRQISEDALKGLTRSVEKFGYVEPIIWNKKTNHIVGGHQRFKVLLSRKIEEAQVVVVELEESEEKALNVALNNRHLMGDWTEEIRAILDEVQNHDRQLFSDLSMDSLLDDIDKMFPKPALEGNTDPDELPERKYSEPIVSEGELWHLGRHRILCGHDEEEKDFKKLTEGVKVDLIFTSMLFEPHLDLENSFKNCKSFSKDGASIYVCYPHKHQKIFLYALQSSGYKLRNQIIWAKNSTIYGQSKRYKYQHDPIYYCYKKGHSDVWYGDKKQTTIWQVDNPTSTKIYPTTKPVKLIHIALLNSSKEGDIVLDPRGASGSTLIASHQYNRTCYVLESNPLDVDLIIERWQNFTGEEAKRQDGALFNDLRGRK